MSVKLDITQARAYTASIAGQSARLAATAAAVLRKTAYDIETDAKALAPVDTAALRSSISTSFTGDGRSTAMSAEVGPTVEYGIYQEYGTSTQPGQPYLGPAYDRRVPGLEAAVAKLAADVVA